MRCYNCHDVQDQHEDGSGLCNERRQDMFGSFPCPCTKFVAPPPTAVTAARLGEDSLLSDLELRRRASELAFHAAQAAPTSDLARRLRDALASWEGR